MLTNVDITIYHQTYDEETRLHQWKGTQYPGVNWYGEQAIAVRDGGLDSASTFVVRIPAEQEVLVASGDMVVKGLLDITINGPSDIPENDIRFMVTAVSDNRRGSTQMRHWKIEGK